MVWSRPFAFQRIHEVSLGESLRRDWLLLLHELLLLLLRDRLR